MARQARKVVDPLGNHAAVQKTYDQKLLVALEKASRSASRSIAAATKNGKDMRASQLRLAKSAIQKQQAQMWREVGDLARAGRLDAAAAAAQTVGLRDLTAMLDAGDVDAASALARGALETARQGVKSLETRISGASDIPLSERVYRNAALSSGKIDDIVNNALATGKTARELANDVRSFISPSTPGGASYAAQRLARTEINNAFHETTKALDINKPWVDGQKWNLSGSHGKPDICNQYADDDNGDGPGVYPPDDTPSKPHPHCFCFITAVTVSPERFIQNMKAGQYNGYIAKVETELGGEESFAITAQLTSAEKSVRAAWNKAKREEREWPSLSHDDRIHVVSNRMGKSHSYVSDAYDTWTSKVSKVIDSPTPKTSKRLAPSLIKSGLTDGDMADIDNFLVNGFRDGYLKGTMPRADIAKFLEYDVPGKQAAIERYLENHPLTAGNPAKKPAAIGRLSNLPKLPGYVDANAIAYRKGLKLAQEGYSELGTEIQKSIQVMGKKGVSPEVLDSLQVEHVQINRLGTPDGQTGGSVLAETAMLDGKISMGQKSYGEAANRVARHSVDVEWWVPVDKQYTSGMITFTHEVGHALFEGVPIDRQIGLLEDMVKGFNSDLARRFEGYDPSPRFLTSPSQSQGEQFKFLKTQQIAWVEANKTKLRYAVSRYGASLSGVSSHGAHELAAEMWCEFVLSSHPRPAAKAFGEAMLKLLEEINP